MATLVKDQKSGKMYIEDIWDFDDFVAVAEGAGFIFTEAQIEEAMERVVDNYNDSSEYGITFVTVESAIYEVVTDDNCHPEFLSEEEDDEDSSSV
jgi:hypothetical protein